MSPHLFLESLAKFRGNLVALTGDLEPMILGAPNDKMAAMLRQYRANLQQLATAIEPLTKLVQDGQSASGQQG